MPELRRDDDLVAAPAQRPAEQRLAEAVLAAVHVGGIDEGDARVECGGDDRRRALLRLGGGAGAAEVVAAEADRRHAEAGAAEGSVFESGHPLSLGRARGGVSPLPPAGLVLHKGRAADVFAMSDSRESMSDAAATLEP